MIRGTFANILLRDELVPGVEGGFTRVEPDDGPAPEFTATVRIDTPTEQEYHRHGGILQYVLCQRRRG